jgi:3-dehydroquinate synthetase
MEDEFEGSSRLILNFGHTIGHAIESLTNYKVPHGIAVAIGMLHEIKDEFIKSELIKLFELLGIEYQMKLNIDDLKKFILQDKKINNNEITIPKLIEIGKCELVKYNLDDYLGGY